MKTIAVVLDHSKETKGTHVWATEDKEAPVTSIYIKKSHFKTDPPQQIKITVEAV